MQLLKQDCIKTKNGEIHIKSKTTYAHKKLDEKDYKCQIMEPLHNANKIDAKLLILARFGMLECRKSRKDSLLEKCPTCDESDDENHRLNYCRRWEKFNLSKSRVRSQWI